MDGEEPTRRADVQITRISVGTPAWLSVESTSQADSAVGRAAAVLMVSLAEAGTGVASAGTVILLGGPPWLTAVISLSAMAVTACSAHHILRFQNSPNTGPDPGGSSS
ncbi:MAG: hypothetical protein ABIS86_05880 [Streptosporangiaceae bacterium]